jgi:hypothetical protein
LLGSEGAVVVVVMVDVVVIVSVLAVGGSWAAVFDGRRNAFEFDALE